MSFIYLASPYTHADPAVMEERYRRAVAICAELFTRGEFVFSPIVHCHPIAVAHNLPRDIAFWHEYSRKMLLAANELWVAELDGWRESAGVAFEIELALEHGIPIIFHKERQKK